MFLDTKSGVNLAPTAFSFSPIAVGVFIVAPAAVAIATLYGSTSPLSKYSIAASCPPPIAAPAPILILFPIIADLSAALAVSGIAPRDFKLLIDGLNAKACGIKDPARFAYG